MVKNLFLIRHAEAHSETKDTTDFKRKLTSRGLEEANLLGKYLKAISVEIDVIYTSPSQRTIETCDQIAKGFDNKPRIITSEEYYEATRNVLIAAVNRVNDLFNNVVIVGHNPSISLLYDYLESNSIENFSTGACAWLQLEISSWVEISAGTANKIDFYYPESIGLE
jgi:phosphohistidine phosphatase